MTAEVAVVGAGPAGITLALELADAGHQVLLIESGSDSYSRDIQRLGDTVGNDASHAPMSMATRRQIGGTSNLWVRALRALRPGGLSTPRGRWRCSLAGRLCRAGTVLCASLQVVQVRSAGVRRRPGAESGWVQPDPGLA